MAKRFTDTDKWRKPSFKSLEAKYKILWLYIMDDCNHAGIWIVDLDVAGMRCGFNYDESETLKAFDGMVEVIKSEKSWFFRSFIDFQYGELNPENRAHNSVINILKQHKIKPLISPLQGAKEKDKDKDKDKGDSKGGESQVSENRLIKWISKNASTVAKMKIPFTEEEAVRLVSEFHRDYIAELLISMHNYEPLLKKSKSANLTFRKWADKDDNYKKWMEKRGLVKLKMNTDV